MPLHRRIRLVRRSREMTQFQLAQRCGVSESTISRYETGRAEPDDYLLMKISDALGVEVSELRQAEAAVA